MTPAASRRKPEPSISGEAVSNSATPAALLAVSTKSLAAMLDMSPRSVDRADAAGLIPSPIFVGGAKRFILDGSRGIRAWLAAGCPKREDFEGEPQLKVNRV